MTSERRRRDLGLLLLCAGLAAPAGAGSAGAQGLPLRTLAGLPADRAALLLSSDQGGGAPAAVAVFPLGDLKQGSAAVVAEVDPSGLFAAEPPPVATVEIFAYALDAAGAVRGHYAGAVDLDLAALGEALWSGGLRLVAPLAATPQAVRAKVLVFAREGGRYALRTVPLGDPSASGSKAPVGGPPRFSTAGSGWVVAATPATAEIAQTAAFPVLVASPEGISGDVLVFGLPAGDPTLTARLGSAGTGDDEPARTLVLPTVAASREATGVSGVDRLRFTLDGAGAPSGGARLELSFEVGPQRYEAPATGVLIVPPASSAATWPTLLRGRLTAPRADAQVPAQRAAKEGDARRVAAIAEGYRRALSLYGETGEAARALEALEAVERPALDGDGLEDLAAAENQVLALLAARDPEALVPPIELHYRRYRERLAARDFAAAVQARSRVDETVRRYLEAAGDEAARRLGARVLARLGGELLTAQMPSKARELLAAALAADGTVTDALLLLAAAEERYGRYAAAVDLLERLVASDPKSPEGRLRLAVNRQRLGDARQANELLRRLVAEDNPPWILALAYQQLARGRLDAGDFAGAADLLSRASDRLPADPALAVTLAYALDRSGRPADARRAAERAVSADRRGPTARWRYTEWPEARGEASDELLATAARVRLPRLAAAVSARKGGR